MKVRIELDPQMDEPEMIIRAPRLTEDVARLQQLILEQKMNALDLLQGSKRVLCRCVRNSLL